MKKSETKIIRAHNEKVKRYRELFIESSTRLEIQIEWLISSYFSRDKKEYAVFNEMFFSDEIQLSFHDKIQMLKILLNVAFPDLKKIKPNIITQLNQIRKLRNRFAHSANVMPRDNKISHLKKEVFFEITEKGESKEVSYTFDYIKEISKYFLKLNKELADQIRKFKREHDLLFDENLIDLGPI